MTNRYLYVIINTEKNERGLKKMKKVFNNSFEMAKELIKDGDHRKWDKETAKFYFTEEYDKYFFASRTVENFNRVVADMQKFINEHTTHTFPCEYEIVCTSTLLLINTSYNELSSFTNSFAF